MRYLLLFFFATALFGNECFKSFTYQAKRLTEVNTLQKIRELPISSKISIGDKQHSTEVFLVGFQDSSLKAIFKPQLRINAHEYAWASHTQGEVLAYKIDRFFGFNMVPPTTSREIDGQWGSVQLYVGNIPSIKEYAIKLNKGVKLTDSAWNIISRHPDFTYQSNKIALFDYLIHNLDRSINNALITKNKKIIAIDQGISFRKSPGKNPVFPFNRLRKRIDKFMDTEEGAELLSQLQHLNHRKFKKFVSKDIQPADATRMLQRIDAFIARERLKNIYHLGSTYNKESFQEMIGGLVVNKDLHALLEVASAIRLDRDISDHFIQAVFTGETTYIQRRLLTRVKKYSESALAHRLERFTRQI